MASVENGSIFIKALRPTNQQKSVYDVSFSRSGFGKCACAYTYLPFACQPACPMAICAATVIN